MSSLTWRRVLAEAAERVGALDARRLVEQAAGYDGAELVLHLEETPTTRAIAYFDGMLERRALGEPLQYVIGHWGFRTLDLVVDARVLIPRPETEEVAGAAIDEARRIGASTVVDLGTGSGAIALSLAVELPAVEVWATDVSADALDVARANAAGVGRAATRVRIVEGRWFDALPGELRGRLDVVVSNPPYVGIRDELAEEVRRWEPATALFAGEDGLDDLRVIVAEAPSWLARPGALVVELAPSQADAVAALARAAAFDDVAVRTDLAGRERMVVARVG